MPNHVTNRIELSGDPRTIMELLTNVQDEKKGLGTIDFNKIIPMPEELAIKSSHDTQRCLKLYKDFVFLYCLGRKVTKDELLHIPIAREEAFLSIRTDIHPLDWTLGKTAFHNLIRYHAPTWYEWCTRNWGTKWNAYNQEPAVDNRSLSFQTAWSAPHPVIEKLAELYPGITFTHQWADEEIGENCGQRIYRDGKLVEESFPNSHKEAVEFAAAVMNAAPENWGLVLNDSGTDYIEKESDSYDENDS